MLGHMRELDTSENLIGTQFSNSIKGREVPIQVCGERITDRLQGLLFECDEAARDCTGPWRA